MKELFLENTWQIQEMLAGSVYLSCIEDCMCLVLDKEWSFASGQDVDQSLSSFLHFW